MANETPQIPEILTSAQDNEEKSFISSIPTKDGKTDESIYDDFFDESTQSGRNTSNKEKKSPLETLTFIFGIIVPIIVFIGVLLTIHVAIKAQDSGKAFENYSFLCKYMNLGVDLPDSQKGCNSMMEITNEYNSKYSSLEEDILRQINEYIPIKIANNIFRTSPERQFIIDTYNNKIPVTEIITQFEKVRQASVSLGQNNIRCNGIAITEDGQLSTDCTVFGGDMGNSDTRGNLGSARIEALRFTEKLADTPNSQFILMNPPSSLGMSLIGATTGPSFFTTQTNLPIQVQYVPFNQKP